MYIVLIQGGKTPLYIAARGSFTAIVDMIIKTARLEYTPKVRVKNIYNPSPHYEKIQTTQY